MTANHVILIGRLWERPFLTKTRHGIAVGNFEISTLHRHRDDSGISTSSVQRHPIRVYGKLAELTRGLCPPQQILIEGRLTTEHTPSSKHGYSFVVAGTVLLLQSPEDDQIQPPLTPRSYSTEDVQKTNSQEEEQK
jgi:single-stranded DNA-binding protein